MDEKKICYNCFREIDNADSACPNCGYDPRNDEGKFPIALPHGTILAGKYITGRVLGQGGFGITYVAQDHKTKQLVAMKEYFPDTMASRDAEHTVTAYTGTAGDNFNYGKDCFLEEAKTLAEFIGNENIVRVLSYFEEYKTAYFAMEYIEGESLEDYIKAHGGKISWEDAVKFLLPVMDALSLVHSKGIIHRDVTPDNIYITKNGVVKLLDFGASRYSLGDRSRSLDVVLKHGFAPKEQYTRHGRQGPYTDVYTVGASFYFALTGKKPPDAIDRIEEDNLMPPTSLGVAISPEAEDAILKALSIQPKERFQTMGEFKSSLLGKPSTEQVDKGVVNEIVFDQTPKPGIKNDIAKAPAPQDNPPASSQPVAGAASVALDNKKIYILFGAIVGVIVILLVAIIAMLAGGKKSQEPLADNSKVSDNAATVGNMSNQAEQGVIMDSPDIDNIIVDEPGEMESEEKGETESEDKKETEEQEEEIEMNVWGYYGEWDLAATDWIFFYGDMYELTENDVHYLEKYYEYEYWPRNASNGAARDTLQMLINEAYAYHGYHFSDENLQIYFNAKPWYIDKGRTVEEAAADMNSIEQKNMKLYESMKND